ncbi:MAG: hypothetical protein ACP5MW_05080, partial [Thermoplasmata archaeon]
MHPSFKSLAKHQTQLISIFVVLAMLITILPLYGNINTQSSSHNATPLFTTNHPNPGNTAWSQWLNNPYKNAVINSTSPMVENLSWNITLPTGNIANLQKTGIPNMPEMIDYNHSIIVGGYNTSYLYSINDTTGNVNWIFEAGPGYTFNVSSVAADNTIMAVANNIQTRNAIVYGINASNGKNLSYVTVYKVVGNPNFVAGSPILAESSSGYFSFINVWEYSANNEQALSFSITSLGVFYKGISGTHSYPVYGGMSNDGTTFNLYETRTTSSTKDKYEVQFVFNSDGTYSGANRPTNKGTVYSWSSPVIINYKGTEQGFFTYAGYGGAGNTGPNWYIDYYSPVTNVNGGSPTTTATLFPDNGPAGGYPTQNLIYTTPLYYNGVFFISVNNGNGLGAGTTNGNTYILNYSYSKIIAGGAVGAPQASFSFGTNKIYANPIISNGIIYVVAGNFIYALNTTNFQKLWYYNTGAPIYTSPIISHGSLYVYNSAG